MGIQPSTRSSSPRAGTTRPRTINVKGKEYVPVSERVRIFNEDYPAGSITTILFFEGDYVRCTATVMPDATVPQRQFTGNAEEDRTQGMINKTNAVENAETSAVGRALAFLGIGVDGGIASADEVLDPKIEIEKKKARLLAIKGAIFTKSITPEQARERMERSGDWTKEEIDSVMN